MDGHCAKNVSRSDTEPAERVLKMPCPAGVLHATQSIEDGLMRNYRFFDETGALVAEGTRAKDMYRASRGYGPISGRIPDQAASALA